MAYEELELPPHLSKCLADIFSECRHIGSKPIIIRNPRRSKPTMAIQTPPKIEWVSNQRIITLRKARRQYHCDKCPEPILKDSVYYSLVVTGSGVNGLKDPDRVHIGCLESKYSMANGA